MAEIIVPPDANFALEDVPKIQNLDKPDIFLDALCVSRGYGDAEWPKKFSEGDYPSLSGFSGRAWMIGLDEASLRQEEEERRDYPANFAIAGLESYFAHYDAMLDAVRYAGREPTPLWNRDCEMKIEGDLADGFIGECDVVDAGEIRRYVMDYLVKNRQPVIALLHQPSYPVTEFVLIAGYESEGETILGRSPYQNPPKEPGPFEYFRVSDWERNALAIIGIETARKAEWEQHPCFLAIESALRNSTSRAEGSKRYGLLFYDAWERLLLDESIFEGASDDKVARILLQHSATAGFIACQKAFSELPENGAPTMGVASGLIGRARSGTHMIHGLMWDVWQVAGGYWRGVKDDPATGRAVWTDMEEVRRFRDRAVRERAAKIVRRACEVDAQALRDLAEAKEEWANCRGRGKSYPCPCMKAPCIRV